MPPPISEMAIIGSVPLRPRYCGSPIGKGWSLPGDQETDIRDYHFRGGHVAAQRYCFAAAPNWLVRPVPLGRKPSWAGVTTWSGNSYPLLTVLTADWLGEELAECSLAPAAGSTRSCYHQISGAERLQVSPHLRGVCSGPRKLRER